MAASIEATEAAILEATSPGFRESLLAQGEARGMIWKDGVLPEEAPAFPALLSYDLLSYGYGLLGRGLRLLEGNGSQEIAQRAFENAAIAIEAVIARGAPNPERGFHRVIAAASYHLGQFSARAYSLLRSSINAAEVTTSERCIVLLMLRDLDGLTELISTTKADDGATDAGLVQMLQGIFEPDTNADAQRADTADLIDVLDLALTDGFVGAMSMAMLAFERGEPELLSQALDRLQIGLDGAAEFNLVPQWWTHRLAIHLLRGLWDASFHELLPVAPAGDHGDEWERLRRMFIASLYRRRKSEIDLWPSQLQAAARILDTHDNLVLSLPTSAGKTRIAELCILACLAEGKRVVFVTPLRALSAQTEAALERTFVPLGKTVSSLYGTIGVSDVDEDILRERDIIVATPEKLDFALRNDPQLLDDVGLVVLDEGHMIGLKEREVRYEIQVQRLLRRPDAANRRIVCLSAILPEGEKVEDFVNWLTDDKPDGLISNDWRPTKLRFGEITWQKDHARLSITVGEEEPFVPRFLTASLPPVGKRRTPFPKDQQELTLAAAWQFVQDGQTVLIFCPLRTSVDAFAKVIVDLNRRGALPSVLESDPAELETALTIGEEWFSPVHPVLVCLRLGVAIHHGSLPTPYRKEVERLLQRGVLKITVSSPTLAQGLNLSASTLIVHSLWRSKRMIDSSEFRNVVGRAGRAYVDLAGLVLHPMFDDLKRRRRNWRSLVDNDALREMESGLVQLIVSLLGRMQATLDNNDLDVLIAYVTGNTAWEFPEIDGEAPSGTKEERDFWPIRVASLDSALLSLLSDSPVADEDIESALDTALSSSLWTRSIARRQEAERTVLRAGLIARAQFVWSRSTAAQRHGYFLAGVGFETGQQLDEHADTLNQLLQMADLMVLNGKAEEAISAITSFAAIVFEIFPFAPKELPPNWEQLLAGWLKGDPVVNMSGNAEQVLDFIEDALVYRLPWALEAVRVRSIAHDSGDDFPWAVVDPDQGLAVAAVETGTLDRSAALLMRAGFPSRSGSLAAVSTGDGQFTTMPELHHWLNSEPVQNLTIDNDWPSRATHDLWTSFANRTTTPAQRTWIRRVETAVVQWTEDYRPSEGESLRATSMSDSSTAIETADSRRIGVLEAPLNPDRQGLLLVTATAEPDLVELDYRGPADIFGGGAAS
jgi:superfamily II DNA/RNA helicase